MYANPFLKWAGGKYRILDKIFRELPAYAGNTFNAQDQHDLAALAREAWQKGIHVVLSNHDTELTRCLYSSAVLKRFAVQRFISCDGDNREAAPELLAVYG